MASTTAHMKGVVHLGNSSHAVHGVRAPRLPHPVQAGQRMASHVQTPHTPDSNPYGVHAAQLANAKTALASAKPYNPRNKAMHKPAPFKKTVDPNAGISVLSKRYKRV